MKAHQKGKRTRGHLFEAYRGLTSLGLFPIEPKWQSWRDGPDCPRDALSRYWKFGLPKPFTLHGHLLEEKPSTRNVSAAAMWLNICADFAILDSSVCDNLGILQQAGYNSEEYLFQQAHWYYDKRLACAAPVFTLMTVDLQKERKRSMR